MSALELARSLSDAANRVVIGMCIACVVAMLGISFTGFVYTLATGAALSWTYSLARLFLPWIGLLSITVALRSGEHVAMTVLVRALPPAGARLCGYGVLATLALFGALLLWYGWEFFAAASEYYMVSDQIQVHGKWTAAAVPITGAIVLVHLLRGVELVNFGLGAQRSEETTGGPAGWEAGR